MKIEMSDGMKNTSTPSEGQVFSNTTQFLEVRHLGGYRKGSAEPHKSRRAELNRAEPPLNSIKRKLNTIENKYPFSHKNT